MPGGESSMSSETAQAIIDEALAQEVIDNYVSSMSQSPLSDVPQIPLPISREADLHTDVQNLFRGMLINQNNLMTNTEFLHKQLAEAFEKIEALTSEVATLKNRISELEVHRELEYDSIPPGFA